MKWKAYPGDVLPLWVAEMDVMPEEVSHGPSYPGLISHTAALREGGPWLDALLAGLDSNRHLLASLLAEELPEIDYQLPQVTFLAWLECRVLNTRLAFGTGGAGHVRLNMATSAEILTEAVRRMNAAID